MPALWRKLVSEPLVHFLFIGAALFGLDRLRASASPDAAGDDASPATGGAIDRSRVSGPILVDASVRKLLVEDFVDAQKREPTPPELEGLVERWIEGEVLYREGMARGLDRDDPGIHQRIAGQMRAVVAAQTIVPTPTDAELEAWFRDHGERFARPERIDFVHVFVKGSDDAAIERAAELHALLAGGADPAGLGDAFSGGRRYRGRKLVDLAEAFGDTFVAGLGEQPEGTWVLRTSRFGQHVVRIERRAMAEAPPFAEVRSDVEKDWRDDRRDRLVAETIQGYLARWHVERRP
jgi:hypothetical protein